MGNSRWDSSAWASYASATVTGKTTSQIFTATKLKGNYDPKDIEFREARDSVANPLSTPIILGADVTGSMGVIADSLMRNGLNTLCKEIYDRKPVTDPAVMVMAIGDAECDTSPLQVTQFESDVSLAAQVTDLWLERGGGPNWGESYLLPHLFASRKIKTDAFELRKRKGYLFTIGDEPFIDGVTATQAAKFLGIQTKTMSAKECVAEVSKTFEVFHIILDEKARLRSSYDRMLREWNDLLPQRVINLADHTKLAETVVSAIQICEGAAKASVAASWDGSTAVVVADAVRSLVERSATHGVQRL
jgi:hypothetical protein